MSKAFLIYILLMIGLLSVFMVGCGDSVKPSPPPETVDLVSSKPPWGSIIQPDATITVTFDDAPGNVAVNPGTATPAGQDDHHLRSLPLGAPQPPHHLG